MPKEVFNKLAANLRGSLITPESSEYDVARKVYNGMIDRRPAAIVRCADVVDVRTAMNFARQERLTVAIRGGDHNGAMLEMAFLGRRFALMLATLVNRVKPKKNAVRRLSWRAGLGFDLFWIACRAIPSELLLCSLKTPPDRWRQSVLRPGSVLFSALSQRV
jgi:hypothetical protein